MRKTDLLFGKRLLLIYENVKVSRSSAGLSNGLRSDRLRVSNVIPLPNRVPKVITSSQVHRSATFPRNFSFGLFFSGVELIIGHLILRHN